MCDGVLDGHVVAETFGDGDFLARYKIIFPEIEFFLTMRIFLDVSKGNILPCRLRMVTFTSGTTVEQSLVILRQGVGR